MRGPMTGSGVIRQLDVFSAGLTLTSPYALMHGNRERFHSKGCLRDKIAEVASAPLQYLLLVEWR